MEYAGALQLFHPVPEEVTHVQMVFVSADQTLLVLDQHPYVLVVLAVVSFFFK